MFPKKFSQIPGPLALKELFLIQFPLGPLALHRLFCKNGDILNDQEGSYCENLEKLTIQQAAFDPDLFLQKVCTEFHAPKLQFLSWSFESTNCDLESLQLLLNPLKSILQNKAIALRKLHLKIDGDEPSLFSMQAPAITHAFEQTKGGELTSENIADV